MRSIRVTSLALLLAVACLASTGCVDAVKDGFSDGVSRGVRDVISNMIEDFLEGLIQQG